MTETSGRITLDTDESLRGAYGEAMEIAVTKARPALDKFSREFISRSPFLCIGTSGADGKADVSPRGDPPGFVQILDDNTIFIPDRPGNNRLDTFGNIVENANVGLLFIVPGFDDTLRVNGKASIVQDQAILDRCEVNGKVPNAGVLVEVNEAFMHCAKAFKRSKLWDSNVQQDRKEMPSLAKIILEQVAAPDAPPTDAEVKEGDEFIEDNYVTGLY